MAEVNNTERRGPIGAEFRSPGPVYALRTLCGSIEHDPRSTHVKRPAHSFGVKHGKLVDEAGPGPKHYPDAHFTRHGKDGTPHYSLASRPKDLSPLRSSAPGAGAYSPEKSGPSASPRAPSYSFGSRSRYRTTDTIPAANSYTLPSTMNRTVESNHLQRPIYSMVGRSKAGGFSEDLQKTPGPASYGANDPNLTSRRRPAFTMRPKVDAPGDSTRKPGPGQHSPENVKIHKKQAPSFTFGTRHSEYLAPLLVEVME